MPILAANGSIDDFVVVNGARPASQVFAVEDTLECLSLMGA